MSSGSMSQKRILVTDTESDFGREIANALVAEGALVFVLVKECRAMQQVLETYPCLTPILLDICKEKCEDQARKLILSLPTIDHFVNLSGDPGLNVITQAYTNAKIHDVSDTKVKPVISKMIEAGGRSLVFHVTFGNQNIMSKLKANLDPRFTNSKTAQISTNLRQSLKKMFSSNGNGETSKNPMESKNSNGNPTTSGGATSSGRTEDTIVRETTVASNFAAMAASLNQNQTSQNGHSDATNGASSTTTTRAPPTNTTRIQSQQERNNKIRQSSLKLQKTCAKKWKKAEKRIGNEQKSALKNLHKELEKGKKVEKANLIKQVSDANASTAARSTALSSDTANRIIEARENRAQKEAEKHAQKKLEKETTVILENKDAQLTAYHEKLYKKMLDREINEFNRIKSKYLV